MRTVSTTQAEKHESPATLTDLRLSLADVFRELRDGEIKGDAAKELANVAGKIIKSVAVQVEYAALRKEKPDIPFAK
jgi:hypothetical protein